MPKYYQQYNKKTLQTISKANYIKDYLLPNSIPQHKQQSFKTLKSANGTKNQKFFYIEQQNVSTQIPISPSLLLNAFRKIYPTSNCSKLDSHSFVNTYQLQTKTLFNHQTQFQQLVDIVILQRNTGSESQSQFSRRTYTKISSCTTLSKTQKEIRDYEVYVVHFVYSQEEKSSVKWDTFVQKYHFRNLNEQEGQSLTEISYSMVFSFTNSACKSYSFLNFVSSNNLSYQFLMMHIDPKEGNLDKLKKLQSYLLHLFELVNNNEDELSQQSRLPCYSPQLKRERKVPAEHFMEYRKLKDKFLKSYKTLNKQFIQNGQIKDVQMKVQNLVCRFLIEHNYNIEKTAKQLGDYLTFDNDLRRNFKLSQFKYWLDMDIINIIGFDRIGRPVILFKTYNFFADKCNDVNDYINFLFYYILVEAMSYCKGYVDEMILLADCSNNTMKNMKLQVNRRMVPTGLKYCPRMFYKLMPFKCTSVPYYAYTIARPLLPAYSSQVIIMVKQGNENQALQECLKWMDVQVIPQVIGGKNTDCKDITQKNPSTRDD